MKSFVAVIALVAVVAADVSHLANPEATAQILKQEQDVEPEQYKYTFETSNGIIAQESGVVKNAGREDAAISVQGSNQYNAPDGTPIHTDYVADENGYQPQEDAAISVQGSNQYNAPDGTPIHTDYVADENGYQPQGAHLPTPPAPQEIPEYILRSLEYIRTHPPAPESPSKKF